VADNTGGLWLFWLELVGTRWQLKFNRHNGTAWAFPSGSSFPADGSNDPRVDSAPFVLFHPNNATQPLWVFWAREEPLGAPNPRWRIVYRVKPSLNPTANDWQSIRALLPGPADSQDREPAALVGAGGNIEVFWSSNRDDSWSIWGGTLTGTHTLETLAPITSGPYAQHDPLPIPFASGPLLIYRSNESLRYTSTVYGATETVDARYAGCTTVDTRNKPKLDLRGQFGDFQTYTYDTGQAGQRTELDWYARDTVGLYVPPGAAEQVPTASSQRSFADVLRQFLPIQVRAVFIVELK
jgi:hypothetical protein